MGAGSDMPPRTSSDSGGIGLIAPLRRSGGDENHGDARHALLARLIDHAPMFPPASLPLAEALAEDARAAARARTRSCSRGSSGLRLGLDELSVVRAGDQRGSRRAARADVPVEAVEARYRDDLESLVGVSLRRGLRRGSARRRARRAARRSSRRCGLRAKVRCGGRRRPEHRRSRSASFARAANAISRSRRRRACTTPFGRTASTAS